MLEKLAIENYALVDKIEIDFKPGLTVLTGETGAGKSVIIGALAASLGGRIDRDHIRHGSSKAVAEATFASSARSFAQAKTISKKSNSNDHQILRREINRSGSSRAFINSEAVNIARLKESAERLADIHSQQGQRNLIDVDRHLDFLDSYLSLTKKRAILAELFGEYTKCRKQLADARRNETAMKEKLELVSFQIKELSLAEISPGQEKELEIDKRRLDSMRHIIETGQQIVTEMSQGDHALLDRLANLNKSITEIAELDSHIKADAEMMAESLISLNELRQNLEGYLSRLTDDPAQLEQINERLAEIYRLKRKYETDEAGLAEKLIELKKEFDGISDYKSLIGELERKSEQARKLYFELALEISGKRSKGAGKMEKAILKHLGDLALPKAEFKIRFHREFDEDGFELDGEKVAGLPYGLETIEFFISTNPKEPLRPLVKIASGGEISRILLAILIVLAGKYKIPTIIFDEIDSGIGGQTAHKLAHKLKELSNERQVIVISHLPIVAKLADNHLAVSKKVASGRNIIAVEELTGRLVTKELSRMKS